MRFFSYYKNNSLVNLSNSILKKYNIETFHPSLKSIDVILKKHSKIALFLFDGLGKSICEKTLSNKSFLLQNKFETISSTFPPTTAAATNAFKSGRYPAEIGWLGWTFDDKISNNVLEMFTHRNYLTKEKYLDFDYNIFNYETIFEMIRRHNKNVSVLENYPLSIEDSKGNGYHDIDDMFKRAGDFVSKHENCLIYSYFLEPDHSLHEYGSNDKGVKSIVETIDAKLEKFVKQNKDTLVLVFADHSHILVEPIFYNDCLELKECVENIYSIESRCASFKLKNGKNAEFLEYYDKFLSNDFDIISKEDAIKNQIFGLTSSNAWLNRLLGDYILIAIGGRSFEPCKNDPMKSTHGGGTEEENLVNLYAFNK